MKTSFVKTLLLTLGTAGLMCAAGNLKAAEIQGVSIYNVSSQQFSYPSTATYSVTNLVSNVGLLGGVFHTYAPGGAMWLSASGLNGTNYVTFNLGGSYTVNGMKVWNYNDGTTASHLTYGVSNASISYSSDGVNFTTAVSSQNFTEGQGTFSGPQTIALTPFTAQYVRFNIKTNWGGGTTGVGLSKVRFISNTNPPTVLSASENFGSNQVTVVFSEPVDPASALNAANYSISGVTISSVAAGEYPDRVILHTSPLSGSFSVNVSGVYDTALTAPVASTAVPVQSELYLWLRADQGVTYATANGVNNMVTSWTDQSPYGHDAQIANFFGVITNGPSWVSGAVNGLPALQFFGTNALQIPNDAANPINGDLTFVMVLNSAGSSIAEDPFNKTGGGSNATTTNNLAAPFDFQFDNALKGHFYVGNNGVVGNELNSGLAVSANTYYVVAVTVTATNLCQFILNGSSEISDLSINPTTKQPTFLPETGAPGDAGNPIAIGARNSGSTGASVANAIPFIGYMPEVMLIRGTITPSDLTSIENYLAAKYNIAPPTITEQPANVTNNVGSQATFWVGTSGEKPFTYQWQSNNVPIIGATNQSYTTPYLTASANGAQYTVGITNASGGTNSMAATLGVIAPTAGSTVSSAVKWASLTNVTVVFSEAVDPTTGLTAGNYIINGGSVSVISAAAGSSANQVILTTTPIPNNVFSYIAHIQNVKDLSGNTMASVTVPLMPAGTVMYLRASSGVLTNGAVGSAVDAWLDQTTNGNNAQAYGIGPSYRPNLSTDGVNKQPAVVFASANSQFLVVPTVPALAFTADYTVYMVADVADYSTYRAFLSDADAATYAASLDAYTSSGNSTMQWNRGDGFSYHSGAYHPGNLPAAGQPFTMDIGQQGIVNNTIGTGYASYNGANPGTTAFSTTYNYNNYGNPLFIGARGSLDLHYNGNMQEILIVTNLINGFDRTNIDNYEGSSYFTFVTNSMPLTNETANAGSTATFTFIGSQGSAHLTYQWMESPGPVSANNAFTNITGATSTTYTTGTLLAGDNGDRFEVVVTAPGVSPMTYTIGPVTLSVVSVAPIATYWAVPFWTSNTIIITFQEPVTPATATNLANYTLQPSGSILSASMWSSSQVLLTTTALTSPPYNVIVSGVQSILGATIGTTNLSNVTGNLYPQNVALWLRPDAGLPNSGEGNSVSEWDDQSGNGNNFYGDGYEPDEPTYSTNGMNGYPSVQFNATNYTYMYASPSTSLALTNDMSVFAIMNFSTYLNPSGAVGSGGGADIISKTTNGLAASYDYYIYYNNDDPYFLRTPSSPFVGAGTAPSTGIWHQLSAVMTGLGGPSPTIYHRLDGRQTGAVGWTGTLPIIDGGAYTFIGTRGGAIPGSVSLTGYLSELLVVGSTLSTNDWDAIETYLGTKYGLLTSPGMLSIAQTNSTTAVVSWLTPQWSFVLQSTTNLVPPVVWSNVGNAVNTVTGTNYVTVAATNSAVFYRLSQSK